jgi:hypothetical protein
MSDTETVRLRSPQLEALERNNYFYGMLLDSFHFTRETGYVNKKIQLLTRLVLGYGVVCGLDVQEGKEDDQIRIMPGMAIDQWGQIIIVPRPSEILQIPPELIQQVPEEENADAQVSTRQRRDRSENIHWLHVLVCYHECPTDPSPVLAGDCYSAEVCEASTIREQYRVIFRPGRLDVPGTTCTLRQFVHGNAVNYDAISDWVTRACPEPPRDPCIPLANIRIETGVGHHCDPEYVETNIRPIVYSNDLLFQMILGLLDEDQPRKGK